MRKIVLSVLGIAAVLALGIAATSVTQSVLAARNVGGGTSADTGGNGGVAQSAGIATSGSAIGMQQTGGTITGQSGSGSGSANTGVNTGDWGAGVDQTGGNSYAVGCGHINNGVVGGTSSNNC
jgi:hypothetical protein